MSVQAMGVLVAPAKTAMKPRPANKSTGAPNNRASVYPKVAPMKNRGVTSPPLNPIPNVMAVNSSFQHHAHAGILPPLNVLTMLMPAGSAEVTPKPV